MLLELPDSLVVTSIDAEKHELVGPVAAEVSQLIGITLWLMAERAKGSESAWAQLLQTLPDSTASPILWEDQVCVREQWCSRGLGRLLICAGSAGRLGTQLNLCSKDLCSVKFAVVATSPYDGVCI